MAENSPFQGANRKSVTGTRLKAPKNADNEKQPHAKRDKHLTSPASYAGGVRHTRSRKVRSTQYDAINVSRRMMFRMGIGAEYLSLHEIFYSV